ncbi:MAG: DUF937 domain-containing protein [Saprospiraceae bacterium]
MLDSILSGIKGQVMSSLTEQTGLDAGQAEQAVPLAKESILSGLTSAVAGGNTGGIIDMLKSATGGASGGGGLMQNMVYQGIATNFIGKITSALGLGEGVAQKVAGVALPMILGKIGGAAQAEGDTDEIDAGSVMSALGMGGGDIAGKAGDLLKGGLGGMFK